MSKEVLEKARLDKACPKCSTPLVRLWGHGWDWDLAICTAKGCDYEEELNESTGFDVDGAIFTINKDDRL